MQIQVDNQLITIPSEIAQDIEFQAQFIDESSTDTSILRGLNIIDKNNNLLPNVPFAFGRVSNWNTPSDEHIKLAILIAARRER